MAQGVTAANVTLWPPDNSLDFPFCAFSSPNCIFLHNSRIIHKQSERFCHKRGRNTRIRPMAQGVTAANVTLWPPDNQAFCRLSGRPDARIPPSIFPSVPFHPLIAFFCTIQELFINKGAFRLLSSGESVHFATLSA
jgi:hypothetical protein